MEVAPFSDQCTAEDVDMSEDDYDKALNFIVAWKDKESATTVREDVESRLKFMRKKSDHWTLGCCVVQDWCKQKWMEWQFRQVAEDTFKEFGFEGFDFHKRNQLDEVSLTIVSY